MSTAVHHPDLGTTFGRGQEQTRFERAAALLAGKGWQVRRCEPSGYYASHRTGGRFAPELGDLEHFANVAKKQHSRRGT